MKIKLHLSRLVIFALFVFTGSQAFAQKSIASIQKLQDKQIITDFKVSEERGTPRLISINSNAETKSMSADAPALLREALALDETVTLSEVRTLDNSKYNTSIVKYQEYYKGIKVEHGTYNALSKDGELRAISLEHYDLDENLNITASLSESAALQSAITFVGATEYAWDYLNLLKLNERNTKILAQLDEAFEAVYPKGQLVIVDDYNKAGTNMRLAYKFNVYAAKPLYRADIYVDALNGKILLADQDIKHAAELNEKNVKAEKMSTFAMIQEIQVATSDTRYAGTRRFNTTLAPADLSDPLNPLPERYVLNASIDVMINGQLMTVPNETRSYDGVGGVPLNVGGFLTSYEITDGSSRLEEAQTVVEIADNFWNADEHYRDRFAGPANAYPSDNEFDNDDTATDAHWGTEIVVRYWAERHNRYSFDGVGGKITSFVHYGDGYDNAFYSNSTMTYGDGSYQGGTFPGGGSFAPLMSLDVAGHEIGHGVCDFTSDLVYARESGGMNEGFSDIWAACVENFILVEIDNTLPYDPYGIGEQIDERDGGLQPSGNRGMTNDPAVRALRNMDDPKAARDPDCILGVNWAPTDTAGCPAPNTGNDQCGVHSNSGVLNKWFYLLTEGSGKTLSPGRSKVAADDEVNDNGEPYSVEGLGFKIAEQIAFQGEIMLTPNALFSEMRDVSLTFARNTYGVGSNEEIQTTNAWHAVCVGDAYVAPTDVNIVQFSSGNIKSVTERSSAPGCNQSLSYELAITTIRVENPTTVTLVTTGSTATEGLDFELSRNQIELSGSKREAFMLSIFDDALVEDSEVIAISFQFLGQTYTQTVTIVDNDVVPTIGTSVQELLPVQEFASSDVPAGWLVTEEIDPSANKWFFNGFGTEAGKAFVSFEAPIGSTGTANYDSNSQSLTTLQTPELSALGLQDVKVTFDWEAGGEFDPAAADQPYDFGSLVYSFDGKEFFPVQAFWAPPGSANSARGTFDAVVPQLANTRFILGFRWSNDTNAATSTFSFSVDNISVTAAPSNVATAQGATVSHSVNQGNDIYFSSVSDGNIIARITNASADLGCVEMTLTGAGTSTVNNSQVGVNRSEKVIQINPSGPNAATATYDVTFYMTSDEVASFADIDAMQIMKVEGSDIDATNNSNTVVRSATIQDFRDTEGYATFTASFTGFSAFAMVEAATAGVNDFAANSGVALYPSPVNRGNNVNITTQDLAITSAVIFDVRGAQVANQKFEGQTDVQLSTSTLQTGFYFVRLNNDKNKTFKFVVK